jgi:hypothetical protein
MTKLYRIIAKTTNSLQPSGTFWNEEVLYCGYDRLEAIRVYHANTPLDSSLGSRSYGISHRVTIAQSMVVSSCESEV